MTNAKRENFIGGKGLAGKSVIVTDDTTKNTNMLNLDSSMPEAAQKVYRMAKLLEDDSRTDFIRVCNRCGTAVIAETEEGLRDEYPYVCIHCDENMYSFETLLVPKTEYDKMLIERATGQGEKMKINN